MSTRAVFAAVVSLGVVTLAAGCGTSSSSPSSTPSPFDTAAAVAAHAKVEKTNLERTILRQMRHIELMKLHLAGEGPVAGTARRLRSAPGLARFVTNYFDTLIRAEARGKAGERAREGLSRFFPRASPALARARYYTRGRMVASGADGVPYDVLTETLAPIHSLRFTRRHDHAVAVIWPLTESYVYVDVNGKVHKATFGTGAEDWNGLEPEIPHRLTLVRGSRGWLVSDDFSLGEYDGDITTALRRGGAPKAVRRAQERRILARVERPIPVPAGAVAAFARFFELLNEHRYRATDALFGRGKGYRAFMFQRPYGSWSFHLQSANGWDALSAMGIDRRRGIPVLLDYAVSGNPGFDYAGGGWLGPAYWEARMTPDGWRIAGAGTDMPWGYGGYRPQ